MPATQARTPHARRHRGLRFYWPMPRDSGGSPRPGVRMNAPTSSATSERKPTQASHSTGTLYVCTSCRPPGIPREPQEGRPGFLLFQQVREAIARSALEGLVDVQPVKCLSVCPRPCGIALGSKGAWTYIFGDQRPSETTQDIVECVRLYLESPDGFMARQARPASLRRSILGRVPPRQRDPQCI